MSRLLPLLTEMRGRLGMYLGTPSIVRLAAFLRGYDQAMKKIGSGTADPFLPAFRDWIHQRFQSSQRSWEETILIHSTDETHALKRFWELLDEFCREQQTPLAESLDANGTYRSEQGGRVGEP